MEKRLFTSESVTEGNPDKMCDGNKTRLQLRADTELKNFPLYCPKCKREILIKSQNLQITVIKV